MILKNSDIVGMISADSDPVGIESETFCKIAKRKPEKSRIIRNKREDKTENVNPIFLGNAENLHEAKDYIRHDTSETPMEDEERNKIENLSHILKYFQQSASNGTQQNTLETLIKTQMSLSRIAQNQETKDETKENPYSLLSQQLIHFQLIQLLQAQLSVQANKNNSCQDTVTDTGKVSPAIHREPPALSPINEIKEKVEDQASSVIIPPEQSPPKSLNTLEMLQRTADEVLTNASKGLLANRLIDSVGEADIKDQDIRHRCRYCGKVFSSDSALQIHIRSHTGERPFKCNICGNRFTTRGNLKVHFQRHSDRFPHIKMNHNPVPEHLDKFYPPLLQNVDDDGLSDPPTSFSMSPVVSPFFRNSLPLPLPQNLINKDRTSNSGFGNNIFDLKRFISSTPPLRDDLNREGINKDHSDEEMDHVSARSSPENIIENEEPKEDFQEMIKVEKERTISPKAFFQSHSIDSLLSKTNPEKTKKSRSRSGSSENYVEHFRAEQKSEQESSIAEEELFKYTKADDVESCYSDSSDKPYSAADLSPVQFSHFPFLGMPMPPKLSMLHGMGIPASPSPMPGVLLPSVVDPAKNPNLYSTLLPRPGSNDSAWEALIEVEQCNEKAKVEQMMGKTREKPTEPNQCGICLRVLSCKSALHMHYRIHTGERPFKCRICGRAFTTKGNLKTHMSVHRAKPPMRMFHQCTVCHKKFSNALILQQHIRLHTGEPTDLSLEQIAAGEIRDMPMDILPFGFPQFPGNGMPSPIAQRMPFSPLLLPFPMNMQRMQKEAMEKNNSFNTSPRSSSESSSENQLPEDLTMKNHDPYDVHRSTVSPMSSDFSDNEEKQRRLSPPIIPLNRDLPISSTPHLDKSKNRFPLLSRNEGIPSNIQTTQYFIGDQANNNKLGNTTCKICFKVFACHSALEIHYRSHTKGNMKQHLSTHKTKPEDGCMPIPDEKTESSVKRFCEDGIRPPEPKRAPGDDNSDQSVEIETESKITENENCIPLPASLNIPSSISHLQFPPRLFQIPFPPAPSSLHLS